MWGVERIPKPRDFKIFVVRSIDDTIELTYSTGVRDFVYVPLNQARRAVERLQNGHYIATDDADIARQYGLNLIKKLSR